MGKLSVYNNQLCDNLANRYIMYVLTTRILLYVIQVIQFNKLEDDFFEDDIIIGVDPDDYTIKDT